MNPIQYSTILKTNIKSFTNMIKLINNQIVEASNFMTIKGQFVSNPKESQLKSEGFKPLREIYVDEVINEYEELEDEIIKYILKPNNTETNETII